MKIKDFVLEEEEHNLNLEKKLITLKECGLNEFLYKLIVY